MKPLSIAIGAMLVLLAVGSAAFAQDDLADFEEAPFAEAIDSLVATVDADAASESPRLGRTRGGYLRFFGAPPDAHAELDDAVRRAAPQEKALAFLGQHGAAFGIRSPNTDFEAVRVRTVGVRTYVRLAQIYDALPVFAAEMIVQLDDQNGVAAVLSDIMTATEKLDADEVSLGPTLTPEEAEEVALAAVAETYEGKLRDDDGNLLVSEDELAAFEADLTVYSEVDLVIYDPAVVGNRGDPCLAWQMIVAGETNPGVAEMVLLDAHSGNVVLSYPLVHSALGRAIYDQENDRWLAPDGLLAREEGDPPTEIQDVDAAYDFFGDTYDFYYTEHGRDSFDDKGMTLEGTVRHCGTLIPCLLLCPCYQAYWDGLVERVYFGDGFAVDDVVAHELTHGITHYTSGLLSGNESGAIKESLSDVWGEFVDLANGVDDPDDRWLIGEDLPLLGPIRDMADPPEFDHPDKMSDYEEEGDPHANAGISNKLCYLLTDGDSFNGRTVYGMGISDVADLYYECQTNLLSSGADYAQLYYALAQAAVNLGVSENDRENVEEACRAVEIRPTSVFAIRDSEENVLVRFTSGGDVVLSTGEILTQQTITPDSQVSEFIVKKGQSDYLALVDSTTGNLYLKGKLYEDVCAVWDYPERSFFINDTDEPVAFINSEDYVDILLEPSYPWVVPAGSLIIQGGAVYLDY